MSSTGKTENLKLSQWELSDPFLMEDMNGDFRKIDEAIGVVPMVKLMDVKLSQSASTVELDLQHFDLTDIIELLVYFPSKRGADMCVNNFTGKLQYCNSNGNWQETSTTVYSPDGKISIKNSYGLGSTKGNVYMSSFNHYYAEASSLGALRNLTFTSSSGFSEGDRFVVLGVRT